MIRGEYLFGNDDDLTSVFDIRNEVFEKEQNIHTSIHYDNLDKEAIHVLIKNDNEAVATGRLVIESNFYKIGRIAVLKNKRGNGFGELVVLMLLEKAFQMGAEYVSVNSQLSVKGFYEKLGFIDEGTVFMEANIEHIKMKTYKRNFCHHCKDGKNKII